MKKSDLNNESFLPVLYTYSRRVVRSGEKIVVLDRDGVIIDDLGYTYKTADLKIGEIFSELIILLKKVDVYLAVCTNQSGVGRGYYSQEEMETFNSHLQKRLLEIYGFSFHFLIACIHQPVDECLCRKPKPGMLFSLIDSLRVEPEQILFVGNSLTDKLASFAAGISYMDIAEEGLSSYISEWHASDN